MGAEQAVGGGTIHHISLGTVESTNDEAMRRARSGVRLPLWVTADRQVSGRGRQGAFWASEIGNLYASLALEISGMRISELPLVAAVALHDALLERLGADQAPRLAIKWPNDILFDGRKLSGILAESQTGHGDTVLAIVGIGVNLAHHPEDTRHPATDLAAEEIALEPADLFISLADCMAYRLAQWQEGQGRGFGQIRAAWLDRASGIGKMIDVRLPGETLSGRFAGLDETGRLVLRQADGTDRLISAGEVFFTDQNDTGTRHGE